MATYIPLPILDESVHFTESNSVYEDAVKAMASGILNYYFPPASGFKTEMTNSPTSSFSAFNANFQATEVCRGPHTSGSKKRKVTVWRRLWSSLKMPSSIQIWSLAAVGGSLFSV